jgi:hypothetical protein
VLRDEQGQPLLDAAGRPVVRPVDVPPGSQVQDRAAGP